MRQVVTRLIEDNLSASRDRPRGRLRSNSSTLPAFPNSRSSPNRLSIAFLGLMVGLALGALWQRMRPRRALILPPP